MEIDALLQKIDRLKPHFGRARDDLETLIARGRAGDYKGVLQSSRLVLEMVLRSMVATELKQTPGKAMLDELITKFRQQANQGIVPIPVLAHMGTVQAWGNLSSHDHAGSLDDEAMKVGREEAVTALNSMVAILTWYAQKYPAPGQAAAEAQPRAAAGAVVPPNAASSSPAPKRVPVVPLALGALAVAAVGGYLAFRGSGSGSSTGPGPAASEAGRKVVDEFYARNEEPSPPPACRTTAPGALGALAAATRHLGDEVPRERAVGEGQLAVGLLEEAAPAEARSPEHWYLLARARLQADPKAAAAALADADRAVKCEGFAAALNLWGKAALGTDRLAEAYEHFEKAVIAAPTFVKPQYNRGLVKLKQADLDAAISIFKDVTARSPGVPEAHFFLGLAYETRNQPSQAKTAYCRARELGYKLAEDRCARL